MATKADKEWILERSLAVHADQPEEDENMPQAVMIAISERLGWIKDPAEWRSLFDEILDELRERSKSKLAKQRREAAFQKVQTSFQF